MRRPERFVAFAGRLFFGRIAAVRAVMGKDFGKTFDQNYFTIKSIGYLWVGMILSSCKS